MTPTNLPRLLQSYFTDRLTHERQASQHTVAAYRDAFRLLLQYAESGLRKPPSMLGLDDLDAPFICRFLNHLEKDRGNTARSRNQRLAAIRSFYRYAALQEPRVSGLIQRVLAIPKKRHHRRIIAYLTPGETDALLAAPDRNTWLGRRDHALLLVAIQTGLRVSELAQLRRQDVSLGTGAHVRCHGKGRKDRAVPLMKAVARAVRAWMEDQGGESSDPLFPNRRGTVLSTDSIQHLVAKHAAHGSQTCATLRKKSVSPHVLRHTCAMRLRDAGVDISVIALWLGHESIETTQIYLDADMSVKEKALARTAPMHGGRLRRYRPDDKLLEFLKSL